MYIYICVYISACISIETYVHDTYVTKNRTFLRLDFKTPLTLFLLPAGYIDREWDKYVSQIYSYT